MFALSYWRCVPPLALAAGLGACSGGIGSPGSPLPSAAAQTTIPGPIPAVGIRSLGLDTRVRPAGKSNLIYASNTLGEDVDAWPNPDTENLGPTCAIGAPYQTLKYVKGFAVDPYGYLVVPAEISNSAPYTWTVSVWKPNCNARVWQVELPSNEIAVDAYSNGATNGAVLAVQRTSSSAVNGLVVCAPSGCGLPFTNPAITYANGVAVSKKGECWLQGSGQGSVYELVYFPNCNGSGELATGVRNSSGYGLFIDTEGHLGSIDGQAEKLWVYSGCNPACSLVSQSTLMNTPVYGGLDAKGENLVIGDPCECGETLDVYKYSPTSGATYSYSITNEVGADWGAHFSPRNKKT